MKRFSPAFVGAGLTQGALIAGLALTLGPVAHAEPTLAPPSEATPPLGEDAQPASEPWSQPASMPVVDAPAQSSSAPALTTEQHAPPNVFFWGLRQHLAMLIAAAMVGAGGTVGLVGIAPLCAMVTWPLLVTSCAYPVLVMCAFNGLLSLGPFAPCSAAVTPCAIVGGAWLDSDSTGRAWWPAGIGATTVSVLAWIAVLGTGVAMFAIDPLDVSSRRVGRTNGLPSSLTVLVPQIGTAALAAAALTPLIPLAALVSALTADFIVNGPPGTTRTLDDAKPDLTERAPATLTEE